jgi:hypothetical protein
MTMNVLDMFRVDPFGFRAEFQTQFAPKYQRTNKAAGKKNIRCFPDHRVGGHRDTGFCGCPVKLRIHALASDIRRWKEVRYGTVRDDCHGLGLGLGLGSRLGIVSGLGFGFGFGFGYGFGLVSRTAFLSSVPAVLACVCLPFRISRFATEKHVFDDTHKHK